MSGMFLRNGALAIVCALAAGGSAAGQTYITFNSDNGDDTYVSAINAGGVVTGSSCGDDFCYGYVRAADGTITVFYGPNTLETAPFAVNRKGDITGAYGDSALHGFLPKPSGEFISFDPPGSTETVATAINDSRVITGYYNTHGFIRAADGTFTTFDPSGSSATYPTAINADGDIAGYYGDAQNNAHGFLRTADGTITSFAVKGKSDTAAYAIDRKNAVVGWYGASGFYGCNAEGKSGSFERKPGGKIKAFAISGAINTQAIGINDKGQITGCYAGSDYLQHGFVGTAKSGFTSFDVPNGSETQPFAINDNGVIAGSFYPATGPLTGFLRMP